MKQSKQNICTFKYCGNLPINVYTGTQTMAQREILSALAPNKKDEEKKSPRIARSQQKHNFIRIKRKLSGKPFICFYFSSRKKASNANNKSTTYHAMGTNNVKTVCPP